MQRKSLQQKSQGAAGATQLGTTQCIQRLRKESMVISSSQSGSSAARQSGQPHERARNLKNPKEKNDALYPLH
jgi:hypothetical protein